jgi:hypothetical protein
MQEVAANAEFWSRPCNALASVWVTRVRLEYAGRG